jgi:hypothetical protein
MAQELFGTYGGIVENVKDPEKLGRVKVRVPHIYGASGSSTGYIGTNNIPWALPAGMPAGGSPASGGFSHLPDVGDHVWVRFLDGEPEKPIWEWGMQTINDAKGLKLHQYNETGGVVGSPKRSGWTRYGHTVELNKDGVLITTSQGYRVQFTDGDDEEFNGLISMATPLGNLLELDDDTGDWTAYVTQSLNLQVIDTIIATARALDLTLTDSATVDIGTTLDVIVGEDVTLDILGKLTLVAGEEINVEAVGDIVMTFTALRLGAGVEPFVLGLQLSAFLESLLLWLSTHVHTSSLPGTPTSPPIVPPEGIVEPPVEELLSETIFGQ